ncbi:RIMS-binding protein 2 isoform X2 [Polypterus senegalus]|uniref:RIMS-binding protein 2 isoform X2 n=1 Tax=Polypterus senegalus TaxID=55291 RepID=UPI00196365B6|nr:RIMS-binding protein 2 isoform X2 [Polypterus senegalus]
MREAAERRQQLDLEHEQAVAVLNAKQQEIDLLQKAQVEAKKEHEGAVHLLEAKVRELEEKCRTQSEQFNLLSEELEKFRLQAGKFDFLSSSPLAAYGSPGYLNKSLSQLINGLATPSGKGNDSPASARTVISEIIQPIQISPDKADFLSVKPAFLVRSGPNSPRRGFFAEMDNELVSTTAKVRYTGKVRLCIARYSYNPYDGPNENPEAELPLVAGKYLYVYGNMDEDGFYEGELLDGQRGLVPSNFVDFVQDEEVPLDQAVDNTKEHSYLNHTSLESEGTSSVVVDSKYNGNLVGDAVTCNNGMGTLDVNIDEIGEDIVPYPRKINLIKQLAKSVIVSWEPPVIPPAWGSISGYNILVDKEVRMSVPFGGRTKSLIEKLNLVSCTYRISIQSITERGYSDELRCTMLVGKDVVVAPLFLRVDNIKQISAELSWMPSNSNYSHTIFLNDAEYDLVKAGCYKYQFYKLKPNSVYKVKVVAQPHQMPWQLPLEQREKREVTVEFCTQPAGPPAPPKDVIVQCGSSPGTIQVSWKHPLLSPTGTSNGASVIGYAVCTKGQKIAEIMFPTAECVLIELNRIQGLEAREVIVRTLSAQGESTDSSVAIIPHSLLVPLPSPHSLSAPKMKPLSSARDSETKEEPGVIHGVRLNESWEPARSTSPVHHGQSLEPPAPHFHSPSHGRRSPSPQRILPQPQGAPIPNTVAKAMAREAAQRVAESNRSIFSERSTAVHPLNSDEEEDGYESPHVKRRGASVDEFLRGSELGRQSQYSHTEDYLSESSRGSDLSDIMEEDEEELYSEMQLEEGGRRRSVTSHNTLKPKHNVFEEEVKAEMPYQKQPCSKRLFSIPEVAEEDFDITEMKQTLKKRDNHNRYHRSLTDTGSVLRRFKAPSNEYQPNTRRQSYLSPTKQGSFHNLRDGPNVCHADSGSFSKEWAYSRANRQSSRSPDSGLDCGSEEEDSRSLNYRNSLRTSPQKSVQITNINGKTPQRSCTQSGARKRTLTRQCSIEEDFGQTPLPVVKTVHVADFKTWTVPCRYRADTCQTNIRKDLVSEEGRSHASRTESQINQKDFKSANTTAMLTSRETEETLILGNPSSTGRADRLDYSGRRLSHSNAICQRPRPMMVPSIEITMDSNSEGGQSRSGSEGNVSPVKEDVYYRSVAGRRKWPLQRSMASEQRYDGYSGQDRHSSEFYDESEPDLNEEPTRIFVALFDYDPLSMSPNPDAADEELPFKEGQIIKVHGDKDTDGFYRGEISGRLGLIPCNMISEIQTDDEEMMEQLIKQGFLPLNTPVEKIVNCSRFKDSVRSVNRRSRKSKRERNRRSGRQHSVSTRRMVALYDYDPRESSPNVDVETDTERETQFGKERLKLEAELTFCAGDILTVFGEIDEDGFYYGEINGHKGLVPSNFLEEVPEDVEVFLSDTPSQFVHDPPLRTKTKRVPSENMANPRRAPSPTVTQQPPPGPGTIGAGSPIRTRDLSGKKKKGLFSKGKKLLKKLGGVK